MRAKVAIIKGQFIISITQATYQEPRHNKAMAPPLGFRHVIIANYKKIIIPNIIMLKIWLEKG